MRTVKILDEIDSMTLSELNTEIMNEEHKIFSIDKQLNDAMNTKITTGQKADAEWYRSATSALKLSRFRLSLMNRRCKQEQDLNALLPKIFMRIAERLLKEDTYKMLIDATKEEMSYKGVHHDR
jgi:hypothetical protein